MIKWYGVGQAVVNPTNTFYSVKRFIGRKMSEVEEESTQVSYKVIRDSNGNVKLECPAINKQFSAEEISAQVGLSGTQFSNSRMSAFMFDLVYTCGFII